MNVREYLHPQVDEVADTLPTALGRRLVRSERLTRLVGKTTRDGIIVNTTGIIGYTMLWLMAKVRPLRPRSFRFAREQAAIDTWLARAAAIAPRNYDLACEVIECQRVLKGYGATHRHGLESFERLMRAINALESRPGAASDLARMRTAALADEDGSALTELLKRQGMRGTGHEQDAARHPACDALAAPHSA